MSHPASKPSSGSYPKGERRKADIVSVALELFAAQGYERTSMVQVAAACGISRAGLLHHFPTKEELLAAVLEERDRIDDARHFDHLDPGRPLEWLAGLVDLAAFNTTQPELVRLFAVLSAEASSPAHPAHDYFVQRYATTRDDYARTVAELVRQGLLAKGVEPEGLEAELIALTDGLQIQWLLDPSIDMPRLLRRRLQQLLSVRLPD
ncbi:TetR/AcrR family transcriptional regulator [Demequina capsici]|uniref:TetR/AcrR family transcriptional regulator n=1 Tax=Demequina capsici TaxID=3075620 RepID=A0AA96J9F6_9MICO|nr:MULTISPECIES: TetR/AcrR family transcriptional regulator [unclassified Demequina]WNM24403.1 TetR/AcrR family transcriptional regulator [Demequina sp. OYTSA14]WNM27237.1 TetR/AcrR family transcriptional regulator [Demequina sp. PMTSA13]